MSHPAPPTDLHCERCGKQLADGEIVWLEMSNTTNALHRHGIPKGESSQGFFPFGRFCAGKANGKK